MERVTAAGVDATSIRSCARRALRELAVSYARTTLYCF